MASGKVVVDTSVFIEHLRSKDKQATALYKIAHDFHLFISSVTLYELMMGAINTAKRSDVANLTDNLVVLPFSRSVATKAADIYHFLRTQNKMIEFRDIFIAATCIVNEIPVKTLNTKDFSRITELELA